MIGNPTLTAIFSCPYQAGGTLLLQIREGSFQAILVTANIIKAIEPFTMSSVKVVQLTGQTLLLGKNFILKIYDRRFASHIREEVEASPWTDIIEEEYNIYMEEGMGLDFISRLPAHTITPLGLWKAKWTAAQKEAYMENYILESFRTEVEVYKRLRDVGVQGKDVPCLIACAILAVPEETFSATGHPPTTVDYPGILLEYIEGFSLYGPLTNVPGEAWQSICDDSIRIVHLLDQLNICNIDGKLHNLFVREESARIYKVFMTDFALCVLREPDETEEEWREMKALQDEEGAVGYALQEVLSRGFVYQRSSVYMELDRLLTESWNKVAT